jgi:predicted amidohydrolase
MRIALAQAAGVQADVAANLAAVRRTAADAAARGARLVVFPEAFLTGYNIGPERIAALAEPADGPSVRALQAIAADTSIAILCGYCERDGDRVYNSAALVDAGRTLATCRKTHLFGQVDRAAFTPGDGFTLATLDGLRVGVLICFDIEFPEPARRLALDGAQLIAIPTSLMAPAHLVAETLVPARAAENQIFVAYANRIGTEGDLDYVGRSCVAGPEGVVAAAGASDETLLFADVDPAAIERARDGHHYLRERRPALYGPSLTSEPDAAG